MYADWMKEVNIEITEEDLKKYKEDKKKS